MAGSALIKVGQCEQRLGQAERDFITSANNCFVVPLRKFLDGEMKTIQKERSLLECRRFAFACVFQSPLELEINAIISLCVFLQVGSRFTQK